MVLLCFTLISDKIIIRAWYSFSSLRSIKRGCKELIWVGTMTQWEGTESREPDPMAGEGDNTLSKETRELQHQQKLSSTWFNTETSCLPVPGTWSCCQAQWLVLASECCGHRGRINYASSQKCDHFINTNNNNNLICTKYYMSCMWWNLHGC